MKNLVETLAAKHPNQDLGIDIPLEERLFSVDMQEPSTYTEFLDANIETIDASERASIRGMKFGGVLFFGMCSEVRRVK